MRRSRLVLLVAVLAPFAALVACGTSAVGVDDCQTIEDALCQRSAKLGCNVNDLPHSGDDVSACTRFYNVACLHGFVTTAAYTKLELNACVSAIDTTKSCGVILAPQTAPKDACAWLVPPEAGVDAGAEAGDAAAADAAQDGEADASDGD